MKKDGYIEITINGSKGNLKLSPESYDIRELKDVIDLVEKLLFPVDRKDRPLISYSVDEGSVRHLFRTSLQVVIGFSAVSGSIIQTGNIDFLELNTAKSIEAFQDTAIKNDYTIELKTSLEDSRSLKITKSTFYYRTTENWVDAEFYFFGKITNAGGKDKANIHLVTDDQGTLLIQTPQEFLTSTKEKILYRNYIIRAVGKQNPSTGEIDKQSLKFLELIDYVAHYDQQYLKRLRSKAMAWLKRTDPDEWVRNMRGYDASRCIA